MNTFTILTDVEKAKQVFSCCIAIWIDHTTQTSLPESDSFIWHTTSSGKTLTRIFHKRRDGRVVYPLELSRQTINQEQPRRDKTLPQPPEIFSLKRRQVEANFESGEITSDGGILLLRELDHKLGLIKAFFVFAHAEQ